MHRQIYTIGFASYETNRRDGSCVVTEHTSLQTLDTHDYLKLSGRLKCLDHHRSEVIQIVDADRIYFLLPLPNPSDLEKLEDGGIVSEFRQAYHATKPKKFVFVRIQYPKAA